MTPEEIALEYPHLTLAPVHAALAYYHVDRVEIDADLAQQEAAAFQWASSVLVSESSAPALMILAEYMAEFVAPTSSRGARRLEVSSIPYLPRRIPGVLRCFRIQRRSYHVAKPCIKLSAERNGSGSQGDRKRAKSTKGSG